MPNLPRLTQTWCKTLSGQVLTDNWMGWWQASSSRTGSKAGPSYKSKEKFLSLLFPSQYIHAAVGLWKGEKKGRRCFIIAIMLEREILTDIRGLMMTLSFRMLVYIIQFIIAFITGPPTPVLPKYILLKTITTLWAVNLHLLLVVHRIK